MKILKLFVAVIMTCLLVTAPLYARSFPIGTRLFTPTISDPIISNPTISGTTTIGSGATITSPTVTTPTITSPVTTLGYTSYAYSSSVGATYSVTNAVAAPAVYRITGGSGSTTFVMTYTGTSASNAGRVFYVINSSSNTVTFKQSGATGVDVATLKIMTVVGNGTDFERITADQ